MSPQLQCMTLPLMVTINSNLKRDHTMDAKDQCILNLVSTLVSHSGPSREKTFRPQYCSHVDFDQHSP
uniref:Uncharacterized protein n=1 Tax=Amphimedon queenslandica TaxID=400682 RepID=A0A1X7VWP9_AMPQE